MATPPDRRLAVLAAHTAAGEPPPIVAVTGAAGYVGSWIVKICLERGWTVRACVRSVEDERKVRFLKEMPQFGSTLELCAADMSVRGAYDEIFAGCSAVFHPAEVRACAPLRSPALRLARRHLPASSQRRTLGCMCCSWRGLCSDALPRAGNDDVRAGPRR